MTRVGLAGYGMAGRQIHAPLLGAAGLEIAAVSTSNPERQAAVQQDHPGAAVVTDLEGLLQVEGLDLIVLATPSAPPSVKSFWTSTMNSALLMTRGYACTPPG